VKHGPPDTLILFLLHWVLICGARAAAQEERAPDSLAAFPGLPSLSLERQASIEARTEFTLPETPVRPGSVRISAGRRLLKEGLDFRLNAHDGRILLMDAGLRNELLRVRWEVLRLDLPPPLSLHPAESLPRIHPDSLRPGAEGALAVLPEREEQIPSELRYSGSFLRGISLGTGGNVGMESGLRLRVDGQIGRDVEVEAFLADRSTPIQPEGRSQSLEEIDRIHVKIRSPRWEATLGDFDLALRQGDYMDYRRTVDGIQGGYRDPRRELRLHAAQARGRFHRMEFSGREGVQGPYQLRTAQGSDLIVVLAGSEKVWIDGLPARRGEDRDYVIDYGMAQIHFTARRPITFESRITAEFQYSERVYTRNLYGAEAAARSPGGAWELDLAYAAERDDPDAPLDQFLDQEDRELLAAAGDSTEAMLGSGIRQVDPGEGSYRLVGEGGQWGHYQFIEAFLDSLGLPELPDSLAGEFIYELYFSELGAGEDGRLLGDYGRRFTSAGRPWWQYEGPGGGSWAPVISLVAPTLQELLDTQLALNLGGIRIELESALSRSDLNLLSARMDEDNLGAALRGRLNWRGSTLKVGDRLLGRPSLRLLALSEQQDFRTLSPVDEVEFERTWGMSRQGRGSLKRAEAELGLARGDSLYLRGGYSRLDREGERSLRLAPAFMLRRGTGPWGGGEASWRSYRGELLHSTFRRLDLGCGWDFSRTWISIAYFGEREERGQGDSASTITERSGERFGEWSGRIERRFGEALRGHVDLRRRLRETLGVGPAWENQALVRQGAARLAWSGRLRGELEWTRRLVHYFELDSSDTVRDVALLDLHAGGERLNWNLLYRAENSLVQERLTRYVQVDSLEGQYSRDPLNPEVFVPDPDGDYIAVQVETGRQNTVARVEVETGLRWQPLPRMHADTRISLEDAGSHVEPLRLYLLDPRIVLGDSTRSGRFRIRQDLELREGGGSESRTAGRRWRLRYEESRDLDRLQLVNPRRNLLRRLSLRLRWSGGPFRLGAELLHRRQANRYSAHPDADRRVRAWELDLRPGRELGRSLLLKGEVQAESGREDRGRQSGRRLSLEPSLEWRVGERGTLQAEFQWQRAWADDERIPYELLSGARVGLTVRAGLEGRINLGRQTRLTLSWRMDQLPGRRVQHTGRVQIQSFF